MIKFLNIGIIGLGKAWKQIILNIASAVSFI
jgi:hypothetical protein